MKFKFSKKTLWLSIVSVMACVAMLAGATFAWFTDTVTSKGNIIEAGDLKVKFDECDQDGNILKSLKDAPLFVDKDFSTERWQPGDNLTKYVRVKNVGTLPLQYYFSFTSPYSEMSKHLEITMTKINLQTQEEEQLKNTPTLMCNLWNLPKDLRVEDPEQVDIYKVNIWFDTKTGNEVNTYGKVDEMVFNMSVNAEQVKEDLSWYNKDNKEFHISTAKQLMGLSDIVNSGKDNFAGKTVYLDNDIDLKGYDWKSIDCVDFGKVFHGTFNGQGYTISNMTGENGLFAKIVGKVQNVNIENATIKGTGSFMGALVGSGYCDIDNCNVYDSSVDATGIKAGGLIGFLEEGSFSVTNCSVFNTNVKGYFSVGGLIGFCHYADGNGKLISNCHVYDGNLECIPYYSNSSSVLYGKCIKTGTLIGELAATGASKTTIENCSSTAKISQTIEFTPEAPYNKLIGSLSGTNIEIE